VRTAFEHVAVTREDDIVELRFHTDGGPLTWTARAHREIGDAVYEVGGDPTVKVVIVTGTGEAFCTRIDGDSFAASFTAGGSYDEIWWEGKRLLKALVDIDPLVIGAVNGPALIHAELVALADVVVAAETSVFADKAHFQTGGVPGDGVHLVWPALLGTTRGNYFLLTGQEIGASEALRLGVVNEVVPPDALAARAWELAREFSTRSVEVLRYTRDALAMSRRAMVANALSHGLAVEGLALRTRSRPRGR
jgi:enoyl-CoA hydratase/carnithine racemase